MSKINVLVVEDELIVSKDIQHSLKKLGYNVVGSAATGEEAIALVFSKKPDIILMDIMLKGDMSGIDTAEIIKEKASIPIIYLTACAEEGTIVKAKFTEPYGYIIKPFKEMDLRISIEMAIYKGNKNKERLKERDLLFSISESKATQDFIFIKANSKLIKLNITEIYFIEALKDYVVINTLDSRYTIHSTMKDIDKKLGSENFIRIHRSFIVRLDKISFIDYPNLHLENDKKTVPIGGSYKEALMNKINLI